MSDVHTALEDLVRRLKKDAADARSNDADNAYEAAAAAVQKILRENPRPTPDSRKVFATQVRIRQEVSRLIARPDGHSWADMKWVTAHPVKIEASTVIVGGVTITWSDGTSAGYGPGDAFVTDATEADDSARERLVELLAKHGVFQSTLGLADRLEAQQALADEILKGGAV